MARPNNMRSGPRPELWKTGPDPETHEQYVAYLKHKSQAHFRGEAYKLKFEDWQWLWLDRWHRRGRGSDCLMLTRVNAKRAWSRSNCMLVTRRTHTYRQLQLKLRNGTIGHIWMDHEKA